MIRTNVVAEGYSELFFAKQVLNNYFNGSRIVDSRCVLTGTNRLANHESCAGRPSLNFKKSKADVPNRSVHVTIMIREVFKACGIDWQEQYDRLIPAKIVFWDRERGYLDKIVCGYMSL